MLGPQSTVFFVLLVVAFGALMWWLMIARRLVVRILAAGLAFIPAMAFGIAAVNKYFDYYQSWSAAIADFGSQGITAVTVRPTTAGGVTGAGMNLLTRRYVGTSRAGQQGLVVRLTVRGQSSKIVRTVYVFLPPQYFWPGYRNYRFPAIELIHGFPGQPQDWISVLSVNSTLDGLMSQRTARPAVLVMPDANGGRGVSLQCLNQVNGPQDATFLASDLPAYISRILRVRQPGAGWGVAGYSEGGFCAANLGLQHGQVFSYAGVLSGYFRPFANQLANPSRRVSPFGGNRDLARLNTPADFLQWLPVGRPVPQFWLGAGLMNRADVRNALIFSQLLQLRQPAVTVRFAPGGGHTMHTWRQLLPPMLWWMTQGLARDVSLRKSPAAAPERTAEVAAATERFGQPQAPGQRYGRTKA